MTSTLSKKSPAAGLRVIAIWKILKGLLLIGVAVGLFKLINQDLADLTRRLIAHLHLDPENYMVRTLLEKIAKVDPKSFRMYGALSLAVSAELFVEGIGLWLNKTWAKYMVLAATAFFVPEETYYCITHVNWERLCLLLLNLLILAYVAWTLWGHKARTRS